MNRKHPLQRKTGFKRGKSPGLSRKNARLRRNTPKRAKINRAACGKEFIRGVTL